MQKAWSNQSVLSNLLNWMLASPMSDGNGENDEKWWKGIWGSGGWKWSGGRTVRKGRVSLIILQAL